MSSLPRLRKHYAVILPCRCGFFFFSAFEYFFLYVAKRVSRPGLPKVSLVFVLPRNDLLLEKRLRVQFGRSKIGTSMRFSSTRRKENLLPLFFSSYLLLGPLLVALNLTSLDSNALRS